MSNKMLTTRRPQRAKFPITNGECVMCCGGVWWYFYCKKLYLIFLKPRIPYTATQNYLLLFLSIIQTKPVEWEGLVKVFADI